jgi:hypothetical protein
MLNELEKHNTTLVRIDLGRLPLGGPGEDGNYRKLLGTRIKWNVE